MANVDGVRITLPDGTEFFGRGNLSIQVEQQTNYVVGGTGTSLGFAQNLFDKAGGDASAVLKTPLATGYVGSASGTRVFEVAFDQWEGNSDSWGPANNGDPPDEKLAVLENEIATASVSSLNPADLEFGPYSSGSSRYEPIPVVFPQLSPSVDFGDGPSIFRSRITCAEAIDLSTDIDNSAGIDADFRLTPADASSPRQPIPADTLGPGGQGRGRQRQGNEAAPSGLVDPNNSGSDPTTQATKIQPSEVRLRGAYRGNGAAALAEDLRADFLTDSTVDRVDLTAPGRSGTTPLTGTYVLTDQSAIDPLVPQVEDGVYGFELVLREA